MALLKRRSTETSRWTGWSPWSELEEMSTRMNQLFDKLAHTGNGEREALTRAIDWAPNANVSETEREYRVTAELPGVAKEDVHVSLEEGALTIRGERTRREEDKGEKMHRVESFYGSFLRRFAMPEDADEGKIDAKFEDGMLTVTIQKTAAKKPAKAKEIAIK